MVATWGFLPESRRLKKLCYPSSYKLVELKRSF